MAENLIERALTRRHPIIRGRISYDVEIPDERLVRGLEFTIAMAICLLFLEVAYMAFLGCWKSEVFAAITGLTGIIIGLFVGKKH